MTTNPTNGKDSSRSRGADTSASTGLAAVPIDEEEGGSEVVDFSNQKWHKEEKL